MIHRALVLAAHGAGDNSAVNRRVQDLAAEVRRRSTFDEVAAGFRIGRPSFTAVLDELHAHDVTVVPLMTSEGYYARTVLPLELARSERYGAMRLRRTAALGTAPALWQLVARRVGEMLRASRLRQPDTAIAVAAHGTPRDPRSREAALRLGDFLRQRFPESETLAVFIDDTPLIEELFSLTQRPAVLVIPFLMGGGPHALRDLPARLGLGNPIEEFPAEGQASGRRVICDCAIGEHPELAEVILDVADRAPPAAGGGSVRPLRLGTRASSMAQRQADRVAAGLRFTGRTVEIVTLTTLGDRDQSSPIGELPGAAPFADDIEQALLAGHIDLAVHSLKDLPENPTAGLTLAAILPRESAAEALISNGNLPLADLPAGAVVGTSSNRRAAQLLAVRPDLRVTDIRGPVDDRVRQVRAGRFAAAILAVAGLVRLGLEDAITQELDLDSFLPAPGQGALAVQVRIDDIQTIEVCSGLDDPATRLATAAELAFLRQSRASHRAAAAHALWDGSLRLQARLIEPDGSRIHDCLVVGDDPLELARRAWNKLVSPPLPVLESRR